MLEPVIRQLFRQVAAPQTAFGEKYPSFHPLVRKYAYIACDRFGVSRHKACEDIGVALGLAVIGHMAASIPAPGPATVVGDRLPQQQLAVDWLHDWAVARAGAARAEEVMARGPGGQRTRVGRDALVLFRPELMPPDGSGDAPHLQTALVNARAQQGWLEEWRSEEKWLRPQEAAQAAGRAPEPDEGSTLAVISLHVRPRRQLAPWRPPPDFGHCRLCGAAPAHGDPVVHDPGCPGEAEP